MESIGDPRIIIIIIKGSVLHKVPVFWILQDNHMRKKSTKNRQSKHKRHTHDNL